MYLWVNVISKSFIGVKKRDFYARFCFFFIYRAARHVPLANSVRTQRLWEKPVLRAHTVLESKQSVPLVRVDIPVQIHRKNRLFALQENTATHPQLLALIVHLGICVNRVVLWRDQALVYALWGRTVMIY